MPLFLSPPAFVWPSERRRKAPGKRSKIDEHGRRLLQADLKERPAATLPERCKFLKKVLG
jgi:hypothetical protein